MQQQLLALKDQICASGDDEGMQSYYDISGCTKTSNLKKHILNFKALLVENAKPNNSYNVQNLITAFVRPVPALVKPVPALDIAYDRAVQKLRALDDELTQLVHLSYIDNGSTVNVAAAEKLYQQIITYQQTLCEKITYKMCNPSITSALNYCTTVMDNILAAYAQRNNFLATQIAIPLTPIRLDTCLRLNSCRSDLNTIVIINIQNIENRIIHIGIIGWSQFTDKIPEQIISLIETDYTTHADKINELCEKFYIALPRGVMNDNIIQRIRNKIAIAPEIRLSRLVKDPLRTQKQAVINAFNAKFTQLLALAIMDNGYHAMSVAPVAPVTPIAPLTRAQIMRAKTDTLREIHRNRNFSVLRESTLVLIETWWVVNPNSTPSEGNTTFASAHDETEHFLNMCTVFDTDNDISTTASIFADRVHDFDTLSSISLGNATRTTFATAASGFSRATFISHPAAQRFFA